MGDWKNCDNCKHADCQWKKGHACVLWKPILCERCGGPLSEVREHNGKRYRHCYSCHSEFFEEE